MRNGQIARGRTARVNGESPGAFIWAQTGLMESGLVKALSKLCR